MKQFSLKQFLLILFLTLSFSINTVFAEGTYMLPKAINLYNSGEYREAYNLAYRIGADNPQCWQAYEIKALSALALNNPGEALANINKALSIKVDISSPYPIEEDAERLFTTHSIILFRLAYEQNPMSINTQYENSILNDVKLLSYTNQNYLTFFLHYIVNSKCLISSKIRLLTKMSSLVSQEIIDQSGQGVSDREFPSMFILGTVLKIVYDADNTTVSKTGKTKENLFLYIKNKTKIEKVPNYVSREMSEEISLHNDLIDLVYFLIINDQENFGYVYTGIKNNVVNHIYYLDDMDDFIKRIKDSIKLATYEGKLYIKRDEPEQSEHFD